MNWRVRASRADTVVLQALTFEEEALFESMKHDGLREAAIFAQLYPPHIEPTSLQDVVLPVALLNKSQLIYLIENKLSAPLPSLLKMDKQDLVMLLGRL